MCPDFKDIKIYFFNYLTIVMLQKISPITQNDCFTLFSKVKEGFDLPLHVHDGFELNFIRNAKGAKRVIGDHVEEIDDLELVLVGGNLQHAWFTHQCKTNDIHETTIQFHKDLFDEKLLRCNQSSFIRMMFEKSARGILFSKAVAEQLAPRILGMKEKQGFGSILDLMSILHDLSISKDMRMLSDASFNNTIEHDNYNSRRIQKVMEYINDNFDKPITLKDAAKLSNMTEVSFSRFFKMQTGKTFVDSLTDVRLGRVSRVLIDTTRSVAEVAYHCGFNNISNFNRIFKRKKGNTPKEYRDNFTSYRTSVYS